MIGQRLAAFANENVTVARLGGDEFGILVRNPGPPEEIIAFCDAICAALAKPIRFGNIQVVTGCSGGLAKYPRAGRDADALFDRADYALYHSKAHRRGKTILFSQEHEDAIRAEQIVETALRTADLSAEMTLHYQPILDTDTGKIALVEGLARWTSPQLGGVSPDRFIAAAERCGLIHDMTLLLLRKALADGTRLPRGIGLSFNLSAQDLASPETVLAILAAVRASGFDPHRLTLELTDARLIAAAPDLAAALLRPNWPALTAIRVPRQPSPPPGTCWCRSPRISTLSHVDERAQADLIRPLPRRAPGSPSACGRRAAIAGRASASS